MNLFELLKSEDHGMAEYQGVKSAYDYLRGLLKEAGTYDEQSAGYLTSAIIQEVNALVCGVKRKSYARVARMCVYQGKCRHYAAPEDIDDLMERLIIKQNKRIYFKNVDVQYLTNFIVDFLQIHPFADGNGRTVKLLLWYMINYKQGKTKYTHMNYDSFCSALHFNNPKSIQEWLQVIVK